MRKILIGFICLTTFLVGRETITIDVKTAVGLVLKNNERVVQSLLSLPREKLELSLATRSWVPRLSIENKTGYERNEDFNLMLTNEVIVDTKVKLESQLPVIGTRMSILGKVRYRDDRRTTPNIRKDNLDGGYRAEVNQPISRGLFNSANRLDFNYARMKFKVDEYNRLIIKKEIIAEVFRRWSSMLVVKEKFSFNVEEVRRQSLLRDSSLLLLETGRITEVEYEQSEVDLKNAKHTLQTTISEMEGLKRDFFYFMGFLFEDFSKYELDLDKDFFLLEEDIFKDDNFEYLVEYALKNNVELKKARSETERARYEMMSFKSRMLPSINIYFFYDQTFYYKQNYHDDDIGGGLKFEYFFYDDEDKKRLEIGKEQFRISKLQNNILSERIKKDFFIYFNKKKQLEVEKGLLEERLAVFRKRWEQAKVLFELGKTTLIELEQVRYEIKQFETEYLDKFNERLDVFLELFLLVHYFPFSGEQDSIGSEIFLFDGKN